MPDELSVELPVELLVFDRQIFECLVADVGAEAAKTLVKSLKAEIKAADGKMRSFILRRDMKSLETLAHGVKSAARSFGAIRLGSICALIENGAKVGQGKNFLEDQARLYTAVSADTFKALDGCR